MAQRRSLGELSLGAAGLVGLELAASLGSCSGRLGDRRREGGRGGGGRAARLGGHGAPPDARFTHLVDRLLDQLLRLRAAAPALIRHSHRRRARTRAQRVGVGAHLAARAGARAGRGCRGVHDAGHRELRLVGQPRARAAERVAVRRRLLAGARLPTVAAASVRHEARRERAALLSEARVAGERRRLEQRRRALLRLRALRRQSRALALRQVVTHNVLLVAQHHNHTGDIYIAARKQPHT